MSLAAINGTAGRIFDIKRFAIHDGPGIRTTLFLKGCPLRCAWCHNPEGIHPRPELVLLERDCIGCGACAEVCPHGAHEITAAGGHIFRRERCQRCERCVEVCYAAALVLYGRSVTVDEVMVELRKDAAFYRNSGGGITLSGGEPFAQPDFTLALLRACKSEGFHTAVDTSGLVNWGTLQAALPLVDLVLYDLKHIDPILHRQYTGVSNRQILENLCRLHRHDVPVEIRIPIIPTINDIKEFIELLALFLQPMKNITAVRLLAYHRLSSAKYRRLGRKNTLPDVEPPEMQQLERIAGWMQRFDLTVILPER